MPSATFQLRTPPDKAGYCRLRLCIHDHGKRTYQPLAVKLRPRDWDQGAQKVKSSHPHAGTFNSMIKLKYAEVQAIMAKQSMTGPVSLDKIIPRTTDKHIFRHFAGKCLDKWEKTKAPGSIRCYASMLKQAAKFDKEVMVEDITPDWLARYEDHSRIECGDGGTLKRVSFISVILKEAIRQGIIEKDPFMVYKKPAKKNPPKIWLTTPELERIEKLAATTKAEPVRNTAYWFLLSCYTGLRYSDIEKFDSKKDIQEGRLILYTQKTGEIVSIKLTPKIKELIKVKNKLPRVYSNQKMNQYLKAVAHLCEIDKVLTVHCGRHTFAVQSANRGISKEVVAKLLGHSDLKTTETYYKIINLRVDNEMKRWEQ